MKANNTAPIAKSQQLACLSSNPSSCGLEMHNKHQEELRALLQMPRDLEWLVTLLIPAKHVLETRSPHLSFMLLKEYWFRELYLDLKVTASFDRTESYTRNNRWASPMHHKFKSKGLNVAWNVPLHQRVLSRTDGPPYVPQPPTREHQEHGCQKRNGASCQKHPPLAQRARHSNRCMA